MKELIDVKLTMREGIEHITLVDMLGAVETESGFLKIAVSESQKLFVNMRDIIIIDLLKKEHPNEK